MGFIPDLPPRTFIGFQGEHEHKTARKRNTIESKTEKKSLLSKLKSLGTSLKEVYQKTFPQIDDQHVLFANGHFMWSCVYVRTGFCSRNSPTFFTPRFQELLMAEAAEKQHDGCTVSNRKRRHKRKQHTTTPSLCGKRTTRMHTREETDAIFVQPERADGEADNISVYLTMWQNWISWSKLEYFKIYLMDINVSILTNIYLALWNGILTKLKRSLCHLVSSHKV